MFRFSLLYFVRLQYNRKPTLEDDVQYIRTAGAAPDNEPDAATASVHQNAEPDAVQRV